MRLPFFFLILSNDFRGILGHIINLDDSEDLLSNHKQSLGLTHSKTEGGHGHVPVRDWRGSWHLCTQGSSVGFLIFQTVACTGQVLFYLDISHVCLCLNRHQWLVEGIGWRCRDELREDRSHGGSGRKRNRWSSSSSRRGPQTTRSRRGDSGLPRPGPTWRMPPLGPGAEGRGRRAARLADPAVCGNVKTRLWTFFFCGEGHRSFLKFRPEDSLTLFF